MSNPKGELFDLKKKNRLFIEFEIKKLMRI